MNELERRFWGKVRFGDGCWEWFGAIKKPSKHAKGGVTIGHGRFRIGDRVHQAHRVAWFLWHGEWPIEKTLHQCDNPRCVRPTHMKQGSLSQNMVEAWARGRRARPGIARADRRGKRTCQTATTP